MDRLSGKTAVVTGAGRGIGRAIALRLARDGAGLIVNDLDPSAAGEVAAECAALGRWSAVVPGDVTGRTTAEAVVGRAVADRGGLDIMVANAGVCHAARVVDLGEDEWDRTMAVNARGVYLCAQAAARHMVEQRRGKIINCASVAGHEGSAYLAHYSASKFAVIGFTQALAKELARFGVTVNAYCPGIVDTEMWAQLDREIGAMRGWPEGEALRRNLALVPLGRPATPDDVAGLVSFLASADADYITGEAIHVDGGFCMR